ncbi:MAG: 1-acyl-sn-glycerol-3-phosphate acyltransferase [Ferruginibacter sp.]
MLYRLLKIPARFALWIYCRHILINDKSILSSSGPLLIACNHPNSFLDAIILCSLFKRPVHSLTRGDVFKNKFSNALLRSLNMLPVYRTSEGVENVEHNYTSFAACKEIFKNNGIVLIFSEGRCINEWHLRSLMKGTARLATSSWQQGIDLKVLPLGINYQSFTSFGKNLLLNFGEIIQQKNIELENGFGKSIVSFNEQLQKALQPLVYEINKNDTAELKQKMGIPISPVRKILLFIPAVAGYLFHWPLYFFIQKYTWRKASHNDHYDSILIGLLFGIYPLYLLLAAVTLFIITECWWGFLLLLAAPFCAWSFVQVKKQF